MATSSARTIALADSPPPAIGLGLWKVARSDAPKLVEEAIRVGYRHIDSACDYGNEVEAGQGIRSAIEKGLCRREDLWITSKLWNTYHEPQHVRPAVERSLHDLGLDSLDLYLVHFPIALEYVPFETRYPPEWIHDPAASEPRMKPIAVPLADTWRAMEDLVSSGLVRRIGLCNSSVALIRDLLAGARIRPAVLQVELHPFLTQDKLLRFCRESSIAVTGFSPLGAPSYVPLGMATAAESVLGSSGGDRHRRGDRTHAGSGGAAVGHAAWHGRDSQDIPPRAAAGESRRLRRLAFVRADAGDLVT
jgi:D-xylose reductase